eukprot:6173727-Pleurochrysis_carterae.AAC.2
MCEPSWSWTRKGKARENSRRRAGVRGVERNDWRETEASKAAAWDRASCLHSTAMANDTR